MPWSVRRLDPTEWRVLRTVRLQALDDAPYAFGATWAETAAREDDWWMTSVSETAWFVVDAGAEATGLAAVIRPEQRAPGGPAHRLVSMWVAPDHRGTGVARQLLAVARTWAADQGADRLDLDVADNNRRARRFYERMGFVATGAAKPLRSHPGVMTLEMRIHLHDRDRQRGPRAG